MGLASSEIAANTIPCCCDNDEGTAEHQEIVNEQQQPFQENKDAQDANNDNFDAESIHNDNTAEDDDFMEDPHNDETMNTINKINTDLLNYQDGDLWTTLDYIFESYQPQELIDAIQDTQRGLRIGLQTILDEFTQHALYQSVVNSINHRKKPFSITKTVAIDHYEKSKYKTQALWFYSMLHRLCMFFFCLFAVNVLIY